MITAASSCLAVVGQPLFGSPWLALGAVLIGVAALMVAIAYVGRILANSHPEPAPRPALAAVPAAPVAAPASSAEPTPGLLRPEIAAIIAAAVATALGDKARIVGIQSPPSVEMLMQQWALEGRRQIYSSHQFR